MPAKRARRPDDRPEEILDAAIDVFLENGFAAARMEEIAKRAGISKGAVYLYFNSKEALLEELVRRSAGRIATAANDFVARSAARDPADTLRQILRFAVRAMLDEKISAAPRIVIAEAPHSPRIAAFYRDEVIRRGSAALTQLIEIGAAQGVFRDVDPRIVLRCVMGPMLASVLLHHVFAAPDMPQPDPETLADEIADFILNGLVPRPEAAS